MSLHDLYLISPQLAVAGVGVLVILLDLLVTRKDVLPVVAFIGLVVPLLLLLHQVSITGASYTLLVGSSEFQADALQGSFSLDKFSLFFNFLILGSVALVILASEDYVWQMARFRGEYFGLLLFSATGMMLLASATELITIYISLELTTLPLAALAAFLMTSKSSEAAMKFLIIGAISMPARAARAAANISV